MSPRILDEQGQELYGAKYVSRDYALQQGMAGYAKDMDKAVMNPRVANNPLVVKAASVEGKARTDLVLSDQDARRLRAAADSQKFLEKARVMVVLD